MAIRHNTYFEGSVQSLELMTDKARATVGVIEPGSSYRFSAEDEEHVRVIEGVFSIKLEGVERWDGYKPGETCVIPAGSAFEVSAGASTMTAYICYYYPQSSPAKSGG